MSSPGKAVCMTPMLAPDVASLITQLARSGLTVFVVTQENGPGNCPVPLPGQSQPGQSQFPPAAQNSTSLDAAVQACLEAKSKANLRPAYLQRLSQYLPNFAKAHPGMAVADVTPEMVEAWFEGRKEKPISRASNLGVLGALFSFAKRRGWILHSPIDRVERVRIDRKVPAILTVEQSRTLLEITRRQWPQSLGFVALALLAGIRPEETSRLYWRDVDLERGLVTVSEAASKIRRRRLVHLMPNAVAWLKVARDCQSVLPIKHTTRRRMIKRLRVAAELPRWPQDIMRHTAASMMLAHTENAGKVALELGNSVTMLLNHYRELVTTEQAQAFWNSFPACERNHQTQRISAQLTNA